MTRLTSAKNTLRAYLKNILENVCANSKRSMAKMFGIVSVVMIFQTIIHGKLKICVAIHQRPLRLKPVTKTENVPNPMVLDLDVCQESFIFKNLSRSCIIVT